MTDVYDPTLGDLVVANPGAARVLERFGLDYCCHGDHRLADACAESDVATDEVLAALAALDEEGDNSWTRLDPPALAEHIVSTHHRYLWDELPLLAALAAKVHSVHGERHPELAEVHRLVAELRADLEPHLRKEETVLFPAIGDLAAGKRDFPFGSIGNPIQVLEFEHDTAGELLAQLRVVTDDHTPPADGCASYHSLYERLAELEHDTHVHIHKENHVLFPAALRLARA